MKKIIVILLSFVYISGLCQYSYQKKNEFVYDGDTISYYEHRFEFSDVNWVINKKNNLAALINKDQRVLTAFKYRNVFTFSEGSTMREAMIDSMWGCVNYLGQEVVPFIYRNQIKTADVNRPFYSTYAVVQRNDDFYGLLDDKGDIILPFEWTDMYYLGNGFFFLAKARKHRKYNEELECYDLSYKKTYLYVLHTNEYIDLKKKRIISMFNEDGFAMITKSKGDKEMRGVIDTSGKTIIPCIYQDMSTRRLFNEAKKKNDIPNKK